LKTAPATTIMHLSVRTIPPEEGTPFSCRDYSISDADRTASPESTKKSLLGFSLRPSIRGRASSSNVPTTTHATPSNPMTHAAPPPVSASVPQPPVTAAAPGAGTPRAAGRTPVQQNITAEPSIRSRSRAAGTDDGTHGTGARGGCKCTIM
jgi:hypothetical protein